MAAYKEEAGAVLQPGNQINRLSSYNTEGVYGWPGVEAYELIGYAKIDNLAATKADDRVRDNRTSLVVQASTARPAYIYGASIAVAQDLPAGGLAGFPASPVTANVGGTDTELLLLGPNNAGVPLGVPATQINGLAAATSTLTIGASGIAQGTSDTTTGDLPFWSVVASPIVVGNAANSMMYRVTADVTYKVFNVDAITDTTVTGDGVFISQDASDAGQAAYLVCRVNYLRPAAAASWNDIQGFVDFASQLGGTDS